MPLDPHYIACVQEPPFCDFEMSARPGEFVRIHRPCLGHVVALHALATPLVSDCNCGTDGWNFNTTCAAVACLLTPPGSDDQVLAGIPQNWEEAEDFLRTGFGHWEERINADGVPEWGNLFTDSLLAGLVRYVAQTCSAPDIKTSRSGGESSKTPWPLQLLSGCVRGGYSEDYVWKLTVSKAFWLRESVFEMNGQSSSVVPMEIKQALVGVRIREAAEKALKPQ